LNVTGDSRVKKIRFNKSGTVDVVVLDKPAKRNPSGQSKRERKASRRKAVWKDRKGELQYNWPAIERVAKKYGIPPKDLKDYAWDGVTDPASPEQLADAYLASRENPKKRARKKPNAKRTKKRTVKRVAKRKQGRS
jgi:hypothetical protein